MGTLVYFLTIKESQKSSSDGNRQKRKNNRDRKRTLGKEYSAISRMLGQHPRER